MTYVETADKRLKIISWGSVIAGALTVLAVSLLLSLLTSGLGLSMVDAQSNDPLSGAGATFGWTSALALLVSLAAGGYLAGYLSGVAGWVHGFLTWALAMLMAAYLSFAAIGGAINIGGQVLGGALKVTGSAVSSVAGAAGNAATGLADILNPEAITNIDGDNVMAQLRQAANQANLEALQPQLIEDQLDGARADITAAGQQLFDNPADYETIIAGLVQQLQERVATLESEINRDDIVQAITDNTSLNEQQVEQAADRALELYQGVATSARDQLNNFEQSVTAAQLRLQQFEANAREQANRAAAASAGAAMWAFFGALLGAVVAVGAAIAGARSPVAARQRF